MYHFLLLFEEISILVHGSNGIHTYSLIFVQIIITFFESSTTYNFHQDIFIISYTFLNSIFEFFHKITSFVSLDHLSL